MQSRFTQMKQITRYFNQVKPNVESGPIQPKRKINDFFNVHTFVVLGEPGLGKTTSFQYAAKKEANGEFVRIGEFLSTPNLDHLKGKVLYIDGLDEHRSRANGVDVMDAIIGRLKQLDTPKIRISCRTAEWHGGKDIGSLSAVSNGADIVQLDLLPLSPEDILMLIPDAEGFVKSAQSHRLDEFLKNPQDFFLLYEFYCEKNSWPDNRSELMEGACKSLLQELNKQHYEAVDDWVGNRDLKRASDYLAAILILSNIDGISSDRTTANKSFPSIHEFDGDLFAMKVATGRHVFKQAEKKRIEPKHRKIAEYMAARYLAARVREGLSLRRVMALMTGIDGGTPPDLRGVYAWLVTMLSGMADHVLVHDPYGAIIYGDSHSWTPNTKKNALKALQNLAKKDPWFRNQDRSRPALGGLSDPVLVEDFKQLFLEDKSQTHLLSTILDAIAGGSDLPEIGDALLDFIRNPAKPNHLKSTAIDAFDTACPDRKKDLITLLDDVHAGDVSDKDQYLRGSLMQILYPKVIGPDHVINYLIKPSGGVIGRYHMFVNHRIFDLTDKDGLRVLAQACQKQNNDFLKGDGYNIKSFSSTLISKLIASWGKDVEIEELFQWLSLGLNKYEASRIRREKTETIQTFITAHDKTYIDLFFYFFNLRWTDETNWHQIWWRFKELVLYTPPPNGFPKALVAKLGQEMDKNKARALYELSCVLVMDDDPSLSSVTIEELLKISKNRPEFNGIFERSSKCDIQEWHLKDALHKKRQIDERKTRQTKNIANIAPHKDAIEAGEAVGILDHYARIWLDLFYDIDHEVSSRERLQKEVGHDMAESIESGFLKALYKPVFNTLEDIAETDTRNSSYHRGYLMLAAMEILADRGKEVVLNLPEDILRVAIAYKMSNPVKKNFDWPKWLIAEKPDFYSCVLDKYWRVQLATKPESITNFYKFNGDEPLLPLVKKILLKLLKDFPKAHPRLLESMLHNAIRFCPFEEIIPLVTNALNFHFNHKSGQRTIWIATGFVIAHDEYFDRLKTQIRKNDQEKWVARPILMANIWKRGEDSKLMTSITYRKSTIELLGSIFKNVYHERGSRWIGDQDEASAAEEVRRLIHAFAEDPSNEAAIALSDLKKNQTLRHWHTDILFTIANQVRTASEARFKYPDVSEVVATLSNAEPANVTDLKAIVVEALKEVGEEIRHGNTDGYKSFWNIGQYSKATDEHIDENTARDRLLELLRPKLKHIDITAEPEVRYADDKRADIAIYSRGMKLPIEIKRDDHPNIWEAAENQLKKQYSRDPEAEGNGIYLVFWFDGKGMQKPKNFKKPTKADELRSALKSTIPEESAGLIDVIVIDVSVPVGKKATKKVPKTKKTKK